VIPEEYLFLPEEDETHDVVGWWIFLGGVATAWLVCFVVVAVCS
jgi:hypothetical protein